MTAAVETIALLTPVVTTNFVFSARRASKGIDAMGSNPAYGVMNMDIAGGQVLKGSRAAISFMLKRAYGNLLNQLQKEVNWQMVF